MRELDENGPEEGAQGLWVGWGLSGEARAQWWGVTEWSQTVKIRNHPFQREIVSSKQFWLIAYLETSNGEGSKGATQSLNALRVFPVYPIFEEEKSNWSDE